MKHANMISKIFIFILFFIGIFILEVGADTVYLKNGRSMEGIIKRETKEGVWLDVGAGTVKFRWDAIENIYRSSPDEIIRMRQELQKQEKPEKWGEEVWLEGYEKRDLEKYNEIKQSLRSQFLVRHILDIAKGGFKSYSSENLKLEIKQTLKKIMWWWRKWQIELRNLVPFWKSLINVSPD